MKSIKRITLLFMAFTFLFISCSKKEKKENAVQTKRIPAQSSPGGVWEMVSKDNVFALKVKSIKNFYSLGIINEEGTKIFGKDLPLDKVKDATGLDSLKLDNLQNIGLDTNKSFIVSIGNFANDPNKTNTEATNNSKGDKDKATDKSVQKISKENRKVNMSILVPALDSVKLKKFLVSSIQKSDKEKKINFTEDGNKSFYEKDGKKIVLESLKNYLGLYFIGDQESFNAMSKESIAQSPDFKNICKKINSNEDIFIYANMNKLYSGLKDTKEGISFYNYSKYYKGMGCAVNLSSKDLKADFYLESTDNKDIQKLFNSGKNAINFAINEVDMPATAILSGTMNFEAYINIIKGSLAEDKKAGFDKGIKNFEEKTGISLKEDLFPATDGSLALCIYDAASINMMNYNTVLTLGVKNKDKAISLIDKVLAKKMKGKENTISKKKEKGFDIYTITMAPGRAIYMAINDKNLFLSFNPQQQLTSQILSGNKGEFQKKYSGISLKELAGNNSIGFYYFNAKEVSKLLELAKMWDKKGYIKKTQEAINNFNYLIYSGNKGKNSLYGKVELNTNFSSSFAKGINELAKKMTPPKTQETPKEGEKNTEIRQRKKMYQKK